MISGVFSLTRQAIQLGYLPRMEVRHTSATEIGQIYIPRVNWLLMAGVLLLVLGFRSSGNLAAAYGIAVTGAMLIDAVLAAMVARAGAGAGVPWPSPVFGGLLLLDLLFLTANALKIPSGGWLPLAVAAAVRLHRDHLAPRPGRAVGQALRPPAGLQQFIAGLDPALIRVDGTGVYMTGNPTWCPTALLNNLEHNQVLHEQVVLHDRAHARRAARAGRGTGRGRGAAARASMP